MISSALLREGIPLACRNGHLCDHRTNTNSGNNKNKERYSRNKLAFTINGNALLDNQNVKNTLVTEEIPQQLFREYKIIVLYSLESVPAHSPMALERLSPLFTRPSEPTFPPALTILSSSSSSVGLWSNDSSTALPVGRRAGRKCICTHT